MPYLCGLWRFANAIYSYIVRGANGGNAIADDLFEFLLDILTDYKDHMIETSLDRIMDRVIHDDMSSIIHWLQLFDSCSKTATDTSCMISNVVFITSSSF